MNRLDMTSNNSVNNKISAIEDLFPNCISENKIDFDMLKQELSNVVLDDSKEKYQLTWPGKKQSIVKANESCSLTLRPLKDKSFNFDSAKNVYIEGDNLDALKILQESYLNKVDCIYIDPPYNTGSDLIYNDKFINENELIDSGQIDENGNRLITNNSSNGRFHSDWLSMMYSRLKLARNLLTEDGIIFISIDENEHSNLKKICDEIFGENNYIGDVVRKTKSMTNDSGYGFNNQHEYLLVYCKDNKTINLVGNQKDLSNYKNLDNDPNGDWCSGDPSAKSGGESTYFPITNPYTNKVDYPPEGRYWAFSQKTLEEYINQGRIKFKENYSEKERGFIFKRYKKDLKTANLPLDSLFGIDNEYMNQAATKELSSLMKRNVFSYPKPVNFIKKLIASINKTNALILDFFSGSATTAHAVMQLNAEDGGNRSFIMIQLPETVSEKETICDIGEERIRRAGKKIKSDTNADIDYGFRVYKVDSSNMKDVYYKPSELGQTNLFDMMSNIKEDRTPEDLLTQVMLDLGLTLDLKIEEKNILNNKVYYVADNALVACFDDNIDINIIDEICKCKPLKVVFKDMSFKSDKDKINLEERVKKLSPDTEISIL